MLEFRPLTLADRGWAQPILYAAGRMGCEYSFANLLFWMSAHGGVARVGDFLCPMGVVSGRRLLFFPCGVGDPSEALEALRQDAAAHGEPFALRGVTESDRAVLDRLYPGKFTYTLQRDSYDYIYPVEQMTELKGKKLQAKRNHINRFLADHADWYTLPLTEDTAPLCCEAAQHWYDVHDESRSLRTEQKALGLALEHFRELEMDGLLLSDGERIVAFTVGNRITREVFDVNFEKAYADVPGAYPLINREFARAMHAKYPEVLWLNREDDMGLEGLRRAKESYHPQFLEKASAVWTD